MQEDDEQASEIFRIMRMLQSQVQTRLYQYLDGGGYLKLYSKFYDLVYREPLQLDDESGISGTTEDEDKNEVDE